MWDTPQAEPLQTTLNGVNMVPNMASTMEDHEGTKAGMVPMVEKEAEEVLTMKDIGEGLLRTDFFDMLRATKDPNKYKDQDIMRYANLFLG